MATLSLSLNDISITSCDLEQSCESSELQIPHLSNRDNNSWPTSKGIVRVKEHNYIEYRGV